MLFDMKFVKLVPKKLGRYQVVFELAQRRLSSKRRGQVPIAYGGKGAKRLNFRRVHCYGELVLVFPPSAIVEKTKMRDRKQV